MKNENEPKVRIPGEVDIELAADGDLNKNWKNTGVDYKTPSERITIREALVIPSRFLESGDTQTPSEN